LYGYTLKDYPVIVEAMNFSKEDFPDFSELYKEYKKNAISFELDDEIRY